MHRFIHPSGVNVASQNFGGGCGITIVATIASCVAAVLCAIYRTEQPRRDPTLFDHNLAASVGMAYASGPSQPPQQQQQLNGAYPNDDRGFGGAKQTTQAGTVVQRNAFHRAVSWMQRKEVTPSGAAAAPPAMPAAAAPPSMPPPVHPRSVVGQQLPPPPMQPPAMERYAVPPPPGTLAPPPPAVPPRHLTVATAGADAHPPPLPPRFVVPVVPPPPPSHAYLPPPRDAAFGDASSPRSSDVPPPFADKNSPRYDI